MSECDLLDCFHLGVETNETNSVFALLHSWFLPSSPANSSSYLCRHKRAAVPVEGCDRQSRGGDSRHVPHAPAGLPAGSSAPVTSVAPTTLISEVVTEQNAPTAHDGGGRAAVQTPAPASMEAVTAPAGCSSETSASSDPSRLHHAPAPTTPDQSMRVPPCKERYRTGRGSRIQNTRRLVAHLAKAGAHDGLPDSSSTYDTPLDLGDNEVQSNQEDVALGGDGAAKLRAQPAGEVHRSGSVLAPFNGPPSSDSRCSTNDLATCASISCTGASSASSGSDAETPERVDAAQGKVAAGAGASDSASGWGLGQTDVAGGEVQTAMRQEVTSLAGERQRSAVTSATLVDQSQDEGLPPPSPSLQQGAECTARDALPAENGLEVTRSSSQHVAGGVACVVGLLPGPPGRPDGTAPAELDCTAYVVATGLQRLQPPLPTYPLSSQQVSEHETHSLLEQVAVQGLLKSGHTNGEDDGVQSSGSQPARRSGHVSSVPGYPAAKELTQDPVQQLSDVVTVQDTGAGPKSQQQEELQSQLRYLLVEYTHLQRRHERLRGAFSSQLAQREGVIQQQGQVLEGLRQQCVMLQRRTGILLSHLRSLTTPGPPSPSEWSFKSELEGDAPAVVPMRLRTAGAGASTGASTHGHCGAAGRCAGCPTCASWQGVVEQAVGLVISLVPGRDDGLRGGERPQPQALFEEAAGGATRRGAVGRS